MDDNSKNTLALISSLINSNDLIESGFYTNTLRQISRVLDADYFGIYFINQDGLELKAELGKFPLEINFDKNFSDEIATNDANAFIINKNKCIAKSKEFIVRVK